MQQVMRIPSRTRCVVRYLRGTARPIGEPDPLHSVCLGLALMSLFVGVCRTVLPGTVSSRLSRAVDAMRAALTADARAVVSASIRQEVAR